MCSALDQTQYALDGPDQYLGPAENRYFGHGFKRIMQTLTVINVVDRDGVWHLDYTCAVVYPRDWSIKAAGAQTPHLSTTDVLLVAVRAASTVVALAHRLTENELACAWVNRVAIRSASRPVENGFESLPVTADLFSDRHLRDTEWETGVEVAVGLFDVTVLIVGPGRGTASRGDDLGAAQVLTSPDRPSPYDAGYRTRTMSTRDLRVDPIAHTIEATSTLTLDPAHCTPSASGGVGFASVFETSASLVDVFVEALQLGQILLYELDGIDRSSSNTLWMRRTVLTASAGRQPAGDVPVSVRLDNSRIINRGRTSWRASDILADRAGTSMTCSVTHIVPASAA